MTLGSDNKPVLHFVFLQGMPCSFFSRIGRRLGELGCRVTGINFSLGDQLFWRGGEAVNYRGSLDAWPRFFRRFIEREGVTDVVLLGEQRSYHKPAVEVAQACGVRVTVTDFGYLRPDWITLERDGMGGNSHFPRRSDALLEMARSLPSPDLSLHFSDSVFNMAVGDLVYSFSNVFGSWLYPNYRRSDKRPHPLIYFPATGLRLLRNSWHRPTAQHQIETLRSSGKRYFVFPLQLEHDFQIVAYSPYDSLTDAIVHVIRSFAKYAPPETLLAVKVHPWDPGFANWRARVQRIAAEHRVGDRVEFFQGGDIGPMIRGSIGMVTVNSTSGVHALTLGFPVKVLGQAIFDLPGLTAQMTLDDFWAAPPAPDQDLVDAFIRVLAGTIQIRGVFFNRSRCCRRCGGGALVFRNGGRACAVLAVADEGPLNVPPAIRRRLQAASR